MITAQEALALVEQSDSTIQRIMEVLSPKIEDAASKGKRELQVYEEGWWGSEESFRTHAVVPSAKQARLIEQLKKHGYHVEFGRISDGYVPRGLAEDDGSGPTYYNMGISIRW